MKYIHPVHLKILCKQGFQRLTFGCPVWPLTPLKSSLKLLISRYCVNMVFEIWSIVTCDEFDPFQNKRILPFNASYTYWTKFGQFPFLTYCVHEQSNMYTIMNAPVSLVTETKVFIFISTLISPSVISLVGISKI